MNSINSLQHATEARPYAKAAFEFAKTKHTLKLWERFFALANEIFQNKDMQFLLANPKLLAEEKAEIMIEIMKSLQKEKDTFPDQYQQNFIRLLSENNRFGLLFSIYILYQNYLAEFDKVISVKVITAFPIEPHQQEKLVKALERKFQSSIVIVYEENKELLGGALVCIGDQIIDSSIKGRLAQLKTALLED